MSDLIIFTFATVSHRPLVFPPAVQLTVLWYERGRGCLCSRPQSQGGVLFPPCVSRLPPPLHKSYTFAHFCSFICPLLSFPQWHSCETFISPWLKQWQVGGLFFVAVKNTFELTDDCLYWYHLCLQFDTFYSWVDAHKKIQGHEFSSFPNGCLLLCAESTALTWMCAGLAPTAFILLYFTSAVSEQSAVWRTSGSPKRWLKLFFIWMLWWLFWILGSLLCQVKLDFYSGDMFLGIWTLPFLVSPSFPFPFIFIVFNCWDINRPVFLDWQMFPISSWHVVLSLITMQAGHSTPTFQVTWF